VRGRNASRQTSHRNAYGVTSDVAPQESVSKDKRANPRSAQRNKNWWLEQLAAFDENAESKSKRCRFA
jgi:hypothetical protein